MEEGGYRTSGTVRDGVDLALTSSSSPAALSCASIQISTFWASILSPYSSAYLSVDFGSDFAPVVAATAALALATASSASTLARSDALSMTSETATNSSETGTEEEGAAPAEAEGEIEESSSDVVFAFCKIFH